MMASPMKRCVIPRPMALEIDGAKIAGLLLFAPLLFSAPLLLLCERRLGARLHQSLS